MENNISSFRKALGLTQPQLAKLAELSNYTVVQRYERGDVAPSVYVAIRIARALNTTVEELFPLEGSDDKQNRI